METIPLGYKQTKVGVIPNHWEEIELSSFINEKIVYCNDEKINLGSLTIEKGVIPKPAQYRREHLVKDTKDAYKLIELNDFVYNPMNLRFGALALYKTKQPLKVSGYYNIFDIDENIVNIDYIYYYLKSERIMFYYNRMAIGSLEEKKRVHFKEFKKFIFPIPPLKEQQKIADILTTLDDVLRIQNELIKNKEKLKIGLMQKLLSGEVRFNSFFKEWDIIRLDKIAIFFKGKGISKSDISNYGTECIRYGELYTKYNEKIENIISKTSLSKEELFLSQKNDILIPASGETAIDLATASCILKNDIGLGGDINIIRTSQNGIFLSYYLNVIAKIKIASLAQGISVMHLYSSQLKTLIIKLPSLIEQQKISEVLTNADKEIDLLQNELEELKKQKKGLMQKLLTGKVRVKV